MSDSQILINTSRYVEMADVDSAKIIYYASPLRWHESLVTQWMRISGHALSSIINSDAATACVEVTTKFFEPLLLDNKIDITLYVDNIGNSSFILRSCVYSSTKKCVEVRAVDVWTQLSDVGPTGARPLPNWLREMLQSQ